MKLALVLLLLQQNAEVHKAPPIKQSLERKPVSACIHCMSLLFNHGGNSITVRSAFGGCPEERAELALLLFGEGQVSPAAARRGAAMGVR